MASPKRSANRPKFDRKPIDLDDLTNASSFSGIRDVIESHFGKPETSDSGAQPPGPKAVPAPGSTAPSVFETDPTRLEYVWEPEEAPISVRLGAELIERLEKESLAIFRAITNRGSEIGGLLLGHVLPAGPLTVVVEDYEPVACAYSLGPTFMLSGEEQQRMRETITRRRAAGDLAVVGFFRSNTRPALVMTEEDSVLFERLFPEEHNIFLMAKPYSRKPCQGAIFVREDRKVRCEASYLEFPFSRAELEKSGALEAAIRVPPAGAGRVTPIRPAAAPSEPERQKPVAPVKPEPERVAAIPAPVESRPTPASTVRAPEAPERAVETKIEPKVEPSVPPVSEARIEPKVQAGAGLTTPPIGTQPAESTSESRRPPTFGTGSGIAAGTRPVWRFKPGLASSIGQKVEPAIGPPAQAEPEAAAKPPAPPAAEAGRAPEQVKPPAPVVPPQVRPAAQVLPPPQVKPTVPVVPPQVRPAAQVLPQQAKPAAQVVPPQAKPAAPVVPPPQAKPPEQVVPAQVKPAAQFVPQQVRPAAQVLPQQVKPPAQVVPPPQAKPAAQALPPQVKPPAQVVPQQVKPAAQVLPQQVKPATQAVPDFRFGAEAAEPEHKGRRWLLVVAALVVAALVLFVLLRPSRQPGAVPAAPAPARNAGPQSASLALRVEGTDSGVMIRWDGSAPAIAAARHGRLSVVDGGIKAEFDLGSAELREGAYAYKPRADDLTIRLELTDAPAGQNAFGTLRILGATRMRGPASR